MKINKSEYIVQISIFVGVVKYVVVYCILYSIIYAHLKGIIHFHDDAQVIYNIMILQSFNLFINLIK